MKKTWIILFLLVIGGLFLWIKCSNKGEGAEEQKTAPIIVKKHSEAFNNSVDRMIQSYLDIKNAFVDADTGLVKQHTVIFIGRIDSIDLVALENDKAVILESARASISDIRANALSLIDQKDITEMRQDFRMITEMMYPAFFKIINYEGPNLYLQNCPMAFENDQAASWISSEIEIMNPYLGKNHPQYKGSMLHCGEIKDTIKAQE